MTVALCIALLLASTTLVVFSVPLYRLFCAATGSGGTVRRSTRRNVSALGRTIVVRFSTNVAPGLAWRFEPEQKELTVHLGEQALAYFRAQNLSDHQSVGHATYNVTPDKVAIYFNKIQCFCFSEEALDAGQTADMPVVFFVDPTMSADPNASEVTTITLAYTFFASANPSAASNLSRFRTSYTDDGTPDATTGKQIFIQRCSSCHALDHDKVGPHLGGVLGRSAGSVAGYPYSAALRRAQVIWSNKSLDQWLTNPQRFVPGTRMAIPLSSPEDRRDVIEYLRTGTNDVANQRESASRTSQP